MQVDSVSSPPAASAPASPPPAAAPQAGSPPAADAPPSTPETAQAENNETSTASPPAAPGFSGHSASSSIEHDSPVHPKGPIVNKTTLIQLLNARTLAATIPTSEKILDVYKENSEPDKTTEQPAENSDKKSEAVEEKAEPKEEKPEEVEEEAEPEEEKPAELPAATELKSLLIKMYYEKTGRKQDALIDVWRGSWYQAVAKQSVDDMLDSINALLRNNKLTSEQFGALVKFNETANRLTQNVDISHEETLADLQSAFDTLAESFNAAMDSAPALKYELESLFATKIDQIQNAFDNTIMSEDEVRKLVESWTEEIHFRKLISFEADQLFQALAGVTIEMPDLTKKDIAEIIYSWTETLEQKQDAQFVIPQFLQTLKTRTDEIGYDTKYL